MSYRVLSLLGKGSFGTAHLAFCEEDGKHYVVKQLKGTSLKPDETMDAVKEARVLSLLDHPNILKYKDSFIEPNLGVFCIVTEWCDGGDLQKCIVAAREKVVSPSKKYFEEEVVLDWFIQLTMALQYIHSRHILHRDLKTGNIFLRKGTIKIGDFGIARMMDSTHDLAQTFTGTPYYMSPEVLQNQGYNSKSDMWALGCILYELCNLQPAFFGENLMSVMYRIVEGQPQEVCPEYSPELRQIVRDLLSKQPADRPSASEILKRPFIKKRLGEFIRGQNEAAIQAAMAVVTPLSPLPPIQGLSPPSSPGKDNNDNNNSNNNPNQIQISETIIHAPKQNRSRNEAAHSLSHSQSTPVVSDINTVVKLLSPSSASSSPKRELFSASVTSSASASMANIISDQQQHQQQRTLTPREAMEKRKREKSQMEAEQLRDAARSNFVEKQINKVRGRTAVLGSASATGTVGISPSSVDNNSNFNGSSPNLFLKIPTSATASPIVSPTSSHEQIMTYAATMMAPNSLPPPSPGGNKKRNSVNPDVLIPSSAASSPKKKSDNPLPSPSSLTPINHPPSASRSIQHSKSHGALRIQVNGNSNVVASNGGTGILAGSKVRGSSSSNLSSSPHSATSATSAAAPSPLISPRPLESVGSMGTATPKYVDSTLQIGQRTLEFYLADVTATSREKLINRNAPTSATASSTALGSASSLKGTKTTKGKADATVKNGSNVDLQNNRGKDENRQANVKKRDGAALNTKKQNAPKHPMDAGWTRIAKSGDVLMRGQPLMGPASSNYSSHGQGSELAGGVAGNNVLSARQSSSSSSSSAARTDASSHDQLLEELANEFYGEEEFENDDEEDDHHDEQEGGEISEEGNYHNPVTFHQSHHHFSRSERSAASVEHERLALAAQTALDTTDDDAAAFSGGYLADDKNSGGAGLGGDFTSGPGRVSRDDEMPVHGDYLRNKELQERVFRKLEADGEAALGKELFWKVMEHLREQERRVRTLNCERDVVETARALRQLVGDAKYRHCILAEKLVFLQECAET